MSDVPVALELVVVAWVHRAEELLTCARCGHRRGLPGFLAGYQREVLAESFLRVHSRCRARQRRSSRCGRSSSRRRRSPRPAPGSGPAEP